MLYLHWILQTKQKAKKKPSKNKHDGNQSRSNSITNNILRKALSSVYFVFFGSVCPINENISTITRLHVQTGGKSSSRLVKRETMWRGGRGTCCFAILLLLSVFVIMMTFSWCSDKYHANGLRIHTHFPKSINQICMRIYRAYRIWKKDSL